MIEQKSREELRKFRRGLRSMTAHSHVRMNRRQCRKLFFALFLGRDASVISKILAAGANPNIYTGDSLMPLQMAVANGDLEVIRVLVGAGAKMGVIKDAMDSGVMPFAARMASAGVMRYLLGLGGDPMARHYVGSAHMSALHLAAREGHHDTLRAMLEAGGKPQEHDTNGHTPAHMVLIEALAQADRTGVLRPNLKPEDWLDFLDLEKLHSLRQFGYEIDDDFLSVSLLTRNRAQKGCVGVAIDMGLSPRSRLHMRDPVTGKFRWLPVMDGLAIAGNLSGYVEAIGRGMAPCQEPLYLAQLVKSAVRRGDLSGLHELRELGVFSAVRCADLLDDVYSSAVNVVSQSNVKLLDFLESVGIACDVDGGVVAASAIAGVRTEFKVYGPATEWLLRRVPNALSIPIGSSGLTAMHYAAAKGDVAFIQYLVAQGGDPSIETENGEQPLKNALEGKHLDAVVYLATVTRTDLRQPLWGKGLFQYFSGRRAVPKETINYLKLFVASQQALLEGAGNEDLPSPVRKRGLSL